MGVKRESAEGEKYTYEDHVKAEYPVSSWCTYKDGWSVSIELRRDKPAGESLKRTSDETVRVLLHLLSSHFSGVGFR